MRSIPNTLWYEALSYPTDQVPAVLDAFVAWQTTGASNVKSSIGLIIGLVVTTVLLMFTSEQATRPSVFSPFDNIPEVTVVVPPTNGTLQSLTSLLGPLIATPLERQVLPSQPHRGPR